MTPYLVVNCLVTPLLRKIKGFSLDLGQKMLNDRSNLQIRDEMQQRSLIVRDAFVHRVGSLGTIPVYVDESYKNWRMTICLDDTRFVDRFPTQGDLFEIADYIELMLEELFKEEKETA